MHQQHECNNFCFSSPESVFVVLEELVTTKLISMRITASFKYDYRYYKDKIKFEGSNIFDKEIKKVSSVYIIDFNNERYMQFYTMNNISEHVKLVQLMESLGNVNHTVSVVGKWIFYSNYKKSLPLIIESLNLVFYCS